MPLCRMQSDAVNQRDALGQWVGVAVVFGVFEVHCQGMFGLKSCGISLSSYFYGL